MYPNLLLVPRMSTNSKIVWLMFYHVRIVVYVMVKFLTSFMLDDHCRVILEGRPGDEGSDYINASFIDVSYNILKLFMHIIVLYICPGLPSEGSLHCHSRPTTGYLW